MSGARTRGLAAIAAAALTTAAASGAAHASAGCDQINAGAWNTTVDPGDITPSLGGIDNGDQLQILSVTGTPGDTIVIEGVPGGPDQLLSVAVGATGGYTVAPPLYAFYRLFNPSTSAVTVTAVCNPAPPPGPSPTGASQSYDRAVTKSFLLSRINGLLLNSPASTSLLTRQQGPQGAEAAKGTASVNAASASEASVGGNPVIRASRFDDDASGLGSQSTNFRSSLSDVRRQLRAAQMERDRMALGAGDGGALPLVYEAPALWDVWAEGRYSGFSDDAGNLDRDGHVGLLFLGGDYRIAPDLIVGGLAQFDWSKDDTGALATKVDGNGWMLGPYLSARMHENIYVDVRAAWGRSSNDLTVGATSAGFDTSRWLVKGAVSGNWTWDGWRATPSAELFYVEESQDAFTNSAGTFVAGQDVSLGRLQFGPEVGYRIAHDADSFIEPFAALKGVWDWDNPNVAIVNGIVVGPGDFWGRLEGGLNVITTGGVVVRGLASWDGIGSDDYSGYTLQAIANVPLN